MYCFVIYVANTSNDHKSNFYKVKKIMTEIIKIIINEVLYLRCEKNSIPINVVYTTKTGPSTGRICR